MSNMDGKKTKTELRGRGWLTMAAAVTLLSANLAFASSTDGAPLAEQVRQEAAAQSGRAFLTIEDLKTLLGVVARDPSALQEGRSNTEVSTGPHTYILNLSKHERAELVARIRETESQRAELTAQVQKQVAGEKAGLRQKRRELQNARLSASTNDAALAKSLFESILTESNLEARSARMVEAFDRSHLINIAWQADSKGHVVQSIAFGQETVWGADATQIARR